MYGSKAMACPVIIIIIIITVPEHCNVTAQAD